MVLNNSYTLEIDTSVCIIISEYEKSSLGLEKAFACIESYIRSNKHFSAKIFCSKTNQEVWSISRANLP